VILSDGDITKRDEVLDFSYEEVKPYLEYRCEAIAIRKGILQMVKENDKESQFCKICKKIGKDDCDNCSKEFKVIQNGSRTPQSRIRNKSNKRG